MTKLWTYKGARKKYPVEVGDVWQVGGHILICGDLEGDQTVLRKWLVSHPPSLMYVDPPWNDQIATQFREKSGVDGDAKRAVDCAKVITRVLELAREMHLLAFMEGGDKKRQMNRDCITALGTEIGDEWTITYTDKRIPCVLWAVDFRKEKSPDWPSFGGLSEMECEDLVLSHYKPKRVFDPCGGLGGTAIACQYAGVSSITHELSPYKMAEAIKTLVKLSQQPATKL